MAYDGTLLYLGGVAIPMDLIQSGSYQLTGGERVELDRYTDMLGVLHVIVAEHTRLWAKLETVRLNGDQMQTLMQWLAQNYTDAADRRGAVRLYDPETDSYIEAEMRLKDPKPTVAFALGGNLYYKPLTLEWEGL